jgi:hypothetical protein
MGFYCENLADWVAIRGVTVTARYEAVRNKIRGKIASPGIYSLEIRGAGIAMTRPRHCEGRSSLENKLIKEFYVTHERHLSLRTGRRQKQPHGPG